MHLPRQRRLLPVLPQLAHLLTLLNPTQHIDLHATPRSWAALRHVAQRAIAAMDKYFGIHADILACVWQDLDLSVSLDCGHLGAASIATGAPRRIAVTDLPQRPITVMDKDLGTLR